MNREQAAVAKLGLGAKQKLLSRLIVRLFSWAHLHGYEIVIEEAYRPKVTAEYYEKVGKGIANSLHTKKLAVDISLFRKGVYLTSTEDYRELGEYWESIGGTWGGRFNDGGHFSLTHNGVK